MRRSLKTIAIMKKNYLLPYKFKKIGMALFLPFLTVCLWLLFAQDGLEFDYFQIPVLAVWLDDLGNSSGFFEMTKTDPINEIGMLGLLVSLCFMALSKEKDEDEMTGQVRMQSFVWSFWVTSAILLLGILFLYDFAFLYFAFVAIFLVFILYILKFNLAMIAIRRENDEK